MGILEAVLGVFDAIGTWIVESVNSLIPMFYGDSGLTFVGVLAVAGLAFSVIFLVCSILARAFGDKCSNYSVNSVDTLCRAIPSQALLGKV